MALPALHEMRHVGTMVMHTTSSRNPELADTQRAGGDGKSASGSGPQPSSSSLSSGPLAPSDGQAERTAPRAKAAHRAGLAHAADSGGEPDSGSGDSSDVSDAARGAYERRMKSKEARRYRIVHEHARGGLGRILRAEDTRLGRTVAIKELLQSSKLAEALFIREALVTARLQHPGIVPVHEAGRWPKGDPFYVMKLVAGKSLQELIREHRTLGERMPLLSNVIAVVETIAYAHSQGVIHRDIKPANILIGEFGETVVVDWGLARDSQIAEPSPAPMPSIEDFAVSELRAQGAADEPPGSVWLISGNYSISGKIIGTPTYMAPEQARGDLVDERADVYALGALLYELMSGNPPYPGRELPVVLEQVLSGPPKPLSELDPAIPQELVTIIEKAMAREPALRYPSARELAADLKRFHTGKLVSAHKYTTSQLIRRWLWRHRSPIAVAAFALLVLAVTGVMSVHRIIQESNIARAERTAARRAEHQAEERERELLLLQAKSALERDPTAALAWLKRSLLSGKYFGRARAIYDTAIAAGVAQHVIENATYVRDLVFSPDAKTVYSVNEAAAVLAMDVATGAVRTVLASSAEKPRKLASVSADGRWIAAARADGVVELRPLSSPLSADPGAALSDAHSAARELGTPGTERAARLKISLNGRYVLALYESGAIRVWDAASGRETVVLEHIYQAIFSPDSTHVFATRTAPSKTRGEAELLVLDVATGTQSQSIALPSMPRIMISSPTGRQVAVHMQNQSLVLIDLPTAELRTLGMYPLSISWIAGAQPIAFSRDGRYFASAGKGYDILLWDLTTLTSRRFAGHGNEVLQLEFTYDSQFLVSASDDGTARVWDLASESVKVLRGHRDDVLVVAVSPHGDRIATASLDKTVRIWPVSPGSSQMRLSGHMEMPQAVAFAGEDRVVSATMEGEVRAWNLRSGQSEELRPMTKEGELWRVFVGHDVRYMVLEHKGAERWELWDLASGTSRALPWSSAQGRAQVLAVAPPLVAIHEKHDDIGSVHVLSLDGNSAQPLSIRGACSAVFSPDRNLLITGGNEGLQAWSLKEPFTKQSIIKEPIDCKSGFLTQWHFSADGSRMLASRTRQELMLWNRHTGALKELFLPDRIPNVVTLSPDGATLAIGFTNRHVSLFDTATGKERSLGRHSDLVMDVRWSPDGRMLASASYDHTIRLWDIERGTSRELLDHSHSVDRLAFSPDGSRLASVSRDRTVRIWDMSRDPIQDEESLRAAIDGGTTAEVADDNDRVLTQVRSPRVQGAYAYEKSGSDKDGLAL